MADANGNNPGDPGYDSTSDPSAPPPIQQPGTTTYFNGYNPATGTFGDGSTPGNSPAAPAPSPTAPSTPAAPGVDPTVQVAQIQAQTAANQLAATTNQNATTNATQQAAAQQADQQLTSAQNAAAATTASQLAESIREFNANHALALQQFGLQQAAQTFSQAVSNAGLTGTYNGQQTQAAQLQAQNEAAQTAALTGTYTPPSNGTAPTGLTGQTPGTVVRDAVSGALGVVGANGIVTPGDASNPAIYAAIQAGAGINTVPDTAFTQAQTPASGQPVQTLAAQQQQFAQQQAAALQQATLSGQQANGTPTEATQQFNTNTQTDMAKLASTLTGPANYFQYLTSLNNGKSIMGALNGAPMPAQSAPVGGTTPQSLQNVFSQLGITPQGLSTGTQQPGVAGQPAATGTTPAAGGSPGAMPGTSTQAGAMPAGGVTGSTSTSGGTAAPTSSSTGVTIPGFEQFGTLTAPNQINPVNWDSLGSTGQQFMLGAYSAAGYNPNDVTSMVNASRPAGQYANASGGQSSAGQTGGTQFAPQAPTSGAFG